MCVRAHSRALIPSPHPSSTYTHPNPITTEYRPPPALARRLAARPPALACPALLPLSAVSNAHLRLYASALASHLHANPDLDIRDVCGTMAVNRTPFKYRHALLARTVPELAAALEAAAAGADVTAPEEDKGQRILFVFTGQGSQWPGVGETLLQFPPYREAVEEADALFSALSGWSILERARALSAEELRDTQYAQPVTFLVQVGLVKLLESFGVLPSIVSSSRTCGDRRERGKLFPCMYTHTHTSPQRKPTPTNTNHPNRSSATPPARWPPRGPRAC